MLKLDPTSPTTPTINTMKLTKLTVIGSALAIAASPMAFAGKGGAAKAEAAEVKDADAEPEVIVCEEDHGKGDVVIDDTDPSEEGEVTTTGGKDDEEGDIEDLVPDGEEGTVDPAVCEVADGEPVPLDWVKRGGGENPEILYAMADGGEPPVFKNETNAATRELGQDEKATDIEAQNAPVAAQINREKKAPVALVKKGRVFLR